MQYYILRGGLKMIIEEKIIQETIQPSYQTFLHTCDCTNKPPHAQ